MAATLTWSKTLGSSASVTTINDRQVVSGATASGNQVRITIKAGSGGSLTVYGCSIGVRDGTTGNYASTPTRITFDGGSNGCTVSAGTTKQSDWISYNFDHTVTHLVHVYRATGYIAYASSGNIYYDSNAVDETMEITGPDTYNSAQSRDITEIWVDTVSGTANLKVAGIAAAAKVAGVSNPAKVDGISK